MADRAPDFTIVIPTRDRPQALERCLQSLTTLDMPRERFEVIVVDDGSAIPVEPIVMEFAETLAVTCLRQPRSEGPGAARNAGAARARGKLLVFTDDDCVAAPGWLSALHETARDTDEPALVGGRIVNALSGNPFSAASQRLIDYLYEYGAQTGPPFQFFCTNNLAVGAEVFRELQGFDARFRDAAGEDRELCDRFAAGGGRLVYEPSAVVHHAHELNARGFLRQHFHYGRSARRFHQLRAQRSPAGVRFEPLAFYFGMLRSPFARHDEQQPWRQMFLLAVSQVAYIAGFARGWLESANEQ